MWIMDLFWRCGGLVCGVGSVEYDVGACSGIFVWFMCACHVGWTRVVDSVGPLGSLRCGVFAGSSSVVLRVSMHARVKWPRVWESS